MANFEIYKFYNLLDSMFLMYAYMHTARSFQKHVGIRFLSIFIITTYEISFIALLNSVIDEYIYFHTHNQNKFLLNPHESDNL